MYSLSKSNCPSFCLGLQRQFSTKGLSGIRNRWCRLRISLANKGNLLPRPHVVFTSLLSLILEGVLETWMNEGKLPVHIPGAPRRVSPVMTASRAMSAHSYTPLLQLHLGPCGMAWTFPGEWLHSLQYFLTPSSPTWLSFPSPVTWPFPWSSADSHSVFLHF